MSVTVGGNHTTVKKICFLDLRVRKTEEIRRLEDDKGQCSTSRTYGGILPLNLSNHVKERLPKSINTYA